MQPRFIFPNVRILSVFCFVPASACLGKVSHYLNPYPRFAGTNLGIRFSLLKFTTETLHVA